MHPAHDPRGRGGLLSDLCLSCFFLHRAKRRGSYFDLLGGAIIEGDTHRTEVRELSAFCFVVCMGNIVSCQGAFAGYLTSSCHDRAFVCMIFNSNSNPKLEKVLRFYSKVP